MEENKNLEENVMGEEPEMEKEENNNEALPTAEELILKIAALEAEIKEKDDKYLRMAAEYDNFRRRSREEREAAYGNAVADTVGELLPILDNLERAAGFSGDKVAEGLSMIYASVGQVLEKLGIETFGAKGDTFDPNLHNAVMHEEDESLGDGEIIEVFQKGYKKDKRIIRFAMVKSAN